MIAKEFGLSLEIGEDKYTHYYLFINTEVIKDKPVILN
jgi:hypothetical protein